ncbi:MAG: SIS domain-containing protein [Nitrososphaerota archaeon]
MREIREQPSAIRETVSAIDLSTLEPLGKIRVKRVILMGMGSSYMAALYGQYLFSQLANMHAHAYLSSDYLYYPPPVDNEDFVIMISQSGETVETVNACRLLVGKGFRNVLALTNTEDSTLARMASLRLVTKAGIEKASATKTYLSALAALNILARVIRSSSVSLAHDLVANVRANLIRISALLEERMDGWRVHCENIANSFSKASTRFLLGRGFNLPTAMTGSLLFKEASKIWVEACDAAEFRHEALDLVGECFAAVLLVSGPTRGLSVKLASKLRRLGGDVIVVLPEDIGMYEGWGEEMIVFPYTVLVQIAAHTTALRRGVDPDLFTAMAKVTLEE